MSEYQYHEWQTVDRVLTADEQAAVNALSSHIDVSPSRAVVTYHWSSFKHDPKQVLLKYFDGYFYLANWGSLRLMFRFPKGLLDGADIEPYCIADPITFETVGRYQVLDLDFNPEDGEGWMEAEAGLAQFIQLRADLLAGDYRLLYLAWLKAATLYGTFDELHDYDNEPEHPANDREPPVPPGLKKLTPALRNFVQVFELDPFLVAAAAEASPEPAQPLPLDQRQLIGRLPPAERDDYLVRLAEGDPSAGLALRKRLAAFVPQHQRKATRPRTIQQLVERAKALKQADQIRQAKAKHKQHIAEMQALAAREAQTWQQAEDLLANGRKIASVYDEATELLAKLQQLSVFQNRPADFQARLRRLAQKYASRPALIERWRRRGWV
ncbi:MAG: hypothetical protein IT317_22675 [Anaerolineales bacterium]|nr:hypothetical protein [Anaerolineales bacterium]